MLAPSMTVELWVQGARREASQLIPGAMHSMDVTLTSPGPWLVQCRTANHQADGMTATIDVAPNGAAAGRFPCMHSSLGLRREVAA